MVKSLIGRTFLEIPATLICPDCHSNFMAVGTLKKVKNFTTWESDEFIQTIKSEYPECINPFHVFFLSVEDFDPKLVETLPDAFQQSHKGLIKHRDDQDERRNIMTEFLKDMRTNFIFPMIEKIEASHNLYFSLAPRHQLFQAENDDCIRTPEKNRLTEKVQKQDRIHAIPLLPAHLEDLSNWIVLFTHFRLVFYQLSIQLEKINYPKPYEIHLFFGSTNLSLFVWSSLLGYPYERGFEMAEEDPQLKEFMDATMFYFGLFDSKMEMKSSQPIKQGYHFAPGNELAWLAWMDLLSNG